MKKICILAISALLLASCGENVADNGKLQVYTSFYPVYDFTRTIGGDDIDLYSVVRSGVEPHDFEPTAADMAKISSADVFIYHGNGTDAWAEKIAETLPDSVEKVRLSDADIVLTGDAHTWLSLQNAERELEAVYKALSTADDNEENNSKYLDRLIAYDMKLDTLENEYEAANLSGMPLAVSHGAFGALCEETGMNQLPIATASGSDPSPAQMAEVIRDIKDTNAKYVFFDPLEGDKLAQSAAQEAGVETAELYAFEGDEDNRDYETVMRFNLEQLKKAR